MTSSPMQPLLCGALYPGRVGQQQHIHALGWQPHAADGARTIQVAC